MDQKPLHQRHWGGSGVLVKKTFSTIKKRGGTSIPDQLAIAGPKLFDDLMNCGEGWSNQSFEQSLLSESKGSRELANKLIAQD